MTTVNFVYDGDGKMVQAPRGGVTMTYAGNDPFRIFNFECEGGLISSPMLTYTKSNLLLMVKDIG